MNTMELGRRIAARRKAAGLTQSELAELMGTKQSAISRLEAGRGTPSLDMIERFAQGTGRPFALEFGTREPVLSRAARRARVQRVLGTYRFDPWERQPTAAEARTLVVDGLTRERFESARTSPAGAR